MSRTSIPLPEFGIEVIVPYTEQELNSLNDQQVDYLRKEIRSAAAKTVLGQYSGKPGEPTVISGRVGIPAIPGGMSGEQLEQIRIARRPKPALGSPSKGKYAGRQIPKNVLISAALGVPEENINTDTGLPASVRNWASLSSVPEERDQYLELVSGGEIQKLNVDGAEELLIKYQDGTVTAVDEEGLSVADITELVGFAPEAVGLGTEFGLASTQIGVIPAIIIGPMAEGAVQEGLNLMFRENALNPELKKSGRERVALLEGSFTRGAMTAALGMAANAVSTLPGKAIAKEASGVLRPDEVALETKKVIDDLGKAAKEQGIDLRLPDVALGEASFGLIQQTDAGRIYLEGLTNRLKKFQDNIYDKDFLVKNQDIFRKELEGLAEKQIIEGRRLLKEVARIDEDVAVNLQSLLNKELKDIENLKASKGLYNYSPELLYSALEPFNASITTLKNKVMGKSDANYKAVNDWANSNKKFISTKDFFERMEKILLPDELDELAELYAKEIRKKKDIRGKDAYDLLKGSNQFDRMRMNYKSLNDLYLLRNVVSKNIEKKVRSVKFKEALKKERLNLLQDKAGIDLLKNADNYYSEYVDDLNKIVSQAGEGFNSADSVSVFKGYKDLTGFDKIINNKSGGGLTNFDTVMKLIDDVDDPANPVLKQEYIKSLRTGYLLQNGAFSGKPTGQITNPSNHDAKLQQRLFGNQFDDLFKTLKDIHKIGGEISPEEGMAFLDEVSRMSRKDAREAYENLKAVAAARVQKEKEIDSFLFKNPSDLNAVQQKGRMAKHVVKENVTDESIETFLSAFSTDVERNAFKALVLEELFANNQKSGYLFNGGKVLEILRKNEDKYEALFGAKKLSEIKKYADAVQRIPKADAKLSSKAMEAGNSKLATTVDGSRVRFYYRWLAGLQDPQKRSKILATHLQMIGEGANSKLRRGVLEMNPDYFVDEVLMNKIMKQIMTTDQGIQLLFAQDDPISKTLLNEVGIYLNLMSREEEAPKVKRSLPDIKK